MFGKSKKSNPDGDIIVLKSTRPGECGGTDATLDKRAPKEILSDKMTFFSADSSFWTCVIDDVDPRKRIGYFSAFAASCGDGTFVFLEKIVGYRDDQAKYEWALVKDDIFSELVKLVRENDIAKENGYHSRTHGLPENFGGSFMIKYESGEKISISDNQAPVMNYRTGADIVKVFDKALSGKKISLPSVSSLKKICYSEERDDGFTKAVLKLLPDGKAINEKQSKYGDSKIYESQKDVSRETVDEIKRNIERCGLFAWKDLPESEYHRGRDKTLTFCFLDGTELTVKDQREVPDKIRNGFFNVELEMTTKH